MLVENRQFEPTPRLFGAFVGGGEWRRWNFAEILGVWKLLGGGVVCVIRGLAIFVELRHVTHRETDGHTMTAYTALA